MQEGWGWERDLFEYDRIEKMERDFREKDVWILHFGPRLEVCCVLTQRQSP
jgi:hypothetical protein